MFTKNLIFKCFLIKFVIFALIFKQSFADESNFDSEDCSLSMFTVNLNLKKANFLKIFILLSPTLEKENY